MLKFSLLFQDLQLSGSLSSAHRNRLLLHALQFPIEPLQRAERFIGANGNLAIFAVAGPHQDADALE